MVGYMAKALAGHDKDKVYIIIAEDGEYVYLADGRIRCVNAPKKKNKKHIQIIKKTGELPEEIRNRLIGHDTVSDLEIKRVIKTAMED